MHLKPTIAVAVLLGALSPHAFAVNYPTEVKVEVQVIDPAKPNLLIGFNNNEGDWSRFNYQITVNGVLWPQFGVDDAITCVSNSADADDCKGASKKNLRDPWTNQKGWRAVMMNAVNVDTDYCVRVITLDQNGKQSPWSAWACAHTPPLPHRPTVAPGLPLITLLDVGSDGKGKVGGATPGKVLVEWNASGGGVVWYTVERAPAHNNGYGYTQVGRLDVKGMKGDPELIDTINDLSAVPNASHPVVYHVCANNAGGKTCGASREFPRDAVDLTAKSARAVVLLGSSKPNIAATATATAAPMVNVASPGASAAVQKTSGFATALAPKPAASPAPTPGLPGINTSKSAFGGTALASPSAFAKPATVTSTSTSTFGTAQGTAAMSAASAPKPVLDWGKAGVR